MCVILKYTEDPQITLSLSEIVETISWQYTKVCYCDNMETILDNSIGIKDSESPVVCDGQDHFVDDRWIEHCPEDGTFSDNWFLKHSLDNRNHCVKVTIWHY